MISIGTAVFIALLVAVAYGLGYFVGREQK